MKEIRRIDLNALPKHEYHTVIHAKHLDAFGHVNNAQYSVLYEEARWAMITSRGYSLQAALESKIGTVVLECSIRFRRELRLHEKISIVTAIVVLSRKTVSLKHLLYKETGELASEASFALGNFDLQTRKLVSPSKNWLDAIVGKIPEIAGNIKE